MAKKNELAKMTSIFGAVDKMNPDASTLEDTNLSTVDEWVSTGCYALNAIISGSLYKGVPRGRITGFAGPSMSGKTFIINKCIANAQKDGYIGVIWDSEVAVDKKGAVGVGVNPAKVKHYPVETVEDCRNQISTFLDAVIKQNESLEEEDRQKFIISIDSLGNLASSKEIKDAEAGKDATDTGTRAKCLLKGTYIKTINGLVKIEDLNIGDKVLTHLCRYKPIKNKWDVKHEEFITIKTKDGDIKMSTDHIMLIKRDNKLQYISAKHIKTTDKLVSIKK